MAAMGVGPWSAPWWQGEWRPRESRPATVAGSSRLARRYNREVNLCPGHLVDVVSPGVERDVLDDLDDLLVAVTGHAHGLHVVIADVAASVGYPGGEAHRAAGFRIVRGATAVVGQLGVVLLRHLLAPGGVRRQTSPTAVELRDGQGGQP